MLTVGRYQVDKVGFDAREDRFGLYVQFDQEVEIIVSKLQIGLKTLATRFGGIIGVGKELLWVLILTFTSLGTLLTVCKNIPSRWSQMGREDRAKDSLRGDLRRGVPAPTVVQI